MADTQPWISVRSLQVLGTVRLTSVPFLKTCPVYFEGWAVLDMGVLCKNSEQGAKEGAPFYPSHHPDCRACV